MVSKNKIMEFYLNLFTVYWKRKNITAHNRFLWKFFSFKKVFTYRTRTLRHIGFTFHTKIEFGDYFNSFVELTAYMRVMALRSFTTIPRLYLNRYFTTRHMISDFFFKFRQCVTSLFLFNENLNKIVVNNRRYRNTQK